jgi:oligopeptide/dipeptide ABC transporter ATP-binding protein
MINAVQNALISVEHLQKQFSTKHGMVTAVDDVSFTVDSAETVALVGESGCGKGTIAMMLLGLLNSDAGRVIVNGIEIGSNKKYLQKSLGRELGIVFQNPYSSLNPKMRIRSIIAEPLKTAFGLRGKPLHSQVEELLGEVGLGREHIKRYPHELSGGQRQRIAIARALALKPKLLILDEPTAALDVSVQAQVLKLLKDLQAELGLSYLFISHDLATVEYLSKRVMVMYLGRIVESASVGAIFTEPKHPYTRALLDSVPSIDPAKRDQLRTLSGEIPSPLNRPVGCAFAPRCRHADQKCRSKPPQLQSNGVDHHVACFHPLFSGVQ